MEPGQHTPEQAPQPARPEQARQEAGYERHQLGNEQRERLGGAASIAEQMPSRPEQTNQPPQGMPAATLPAPQADDASSTVASTTATDDTPLVASDDDVIEKEWVDKAKKIIAETKDEPYKREQAVKQLQIEYVRKRYGREIGDPGD